MQECNQLFSGIKLAEPKRRKPGRPRKSTAPVSKNRKLDGRGRPINPGPSRRELAQEIRAFLAISGISQTLFGLQAANDDKILWRLEQAPNGISLDKADRIRDFMAKWQEERDADHAGNRSEKACAE